MGWFVLSVLMTGLLQFFISYTMALLAFWVLEVSTFIFILFAFEYIAGGHLFPLNILPPAVAGMLAYTPFPYLLFFPVSIYLNQVTGPALYRGLVIQTFWIGVAPVEPGIPDRHSIPTRPSATQLATKSSHGSPAATARRTRFP